MSGTQINIYDLISEYKTLVKEIANKDRNISRLAKQKLNELFERFGGINNVKEFAKKLSNTLSSSQKELEEKIAMLDKSNLWMEYGFRKPMLENQLKEYKYKQALMQEIYQEITRYQEQATMPSILKKRFENMRQEAMFYKSFESPLTPISTVSLSTQSTLPPEEHAKPPQKSKKLSPLIRVAASERTSPKKKGDRRPHTPD